MKRTKTPYFREPVVSSTGSQIAFSYGGDIWIVSAFGGSARRITAHPSFDSHPIFSPDDTMLAFASLRTGGGNIYTLSLASHEPPRRLTYHEGAAPPASWSPDGKWIYFTSYYEGLGGAIYKIPIDGGTPIKVLGDPLEVHYNAAISPNGKKLAFNNNGDYWWRRGPNPAGYSDIWIADEIAESNELQRLTQYRGRNLRPMWDENGNGIYYLCDQNGVENIWYAELNKNKKVLPITNFDNGRVLRPTISADGKWIVFERDFKIWMLNLETRESHPVNIQVNADTKLNPVDYRNFSSNINEFELAPDGKKIAFTVRGNVFADMANKNESTRNGYSFKVTEGVSRESQITWNSESNMVVYISERTGNNELFGYHFVKRTEEQLTDSLTQKYSPQFSPDGKWLAYIQGNAEIWLMDTETKEKKAFIREQLFLSVPKPTEFIWSPDSQWILFLASDKHLFCNLYVQHIDSDTSRQLTFLSNHGTYRPLWSPDGKFIIFNTGHHRMENQIARLDLKPVQPIFKEDYFDKLFQPESPDKPQNDTPEKNGSEEVAEVTEVPPDDGEEKETEIKDSNSADKNDEKQAVKEKKIPAVEIEFEGIKQRLSFLTDFKMDAEAMSIRSDSKTLIFVAPIVGDYNLWSLSLEAEKRWDLPRQLTSSSAWKYNARFSPDGKKLFYIDGKKIYSIGINENGSRKSSPEVLETNAEVKYDFHLGKIQAFKEGWRLIRDHFYDPNLHGCNWEEIYKQFLPVLESVQTRIEFREILNLMVGELNASHLGAYGGGAHGGAPDSFLGVELDRLELEREGRFKIVYVLPGSPLALPEEPARPGEYLVEVNGVQLGKNQNLPELLQRQIGKRVIVKVNTQPELENARELQIQPISGYKYRKMRYQEWVNHNIAYVNKQSNSRLGYVHIPSMSYGSYMKFLADLDTEMHDKEGVVLDIRFNVGGYTATFILDVLYRKAYTRSSYRGMVNFNDANLAGERVWEKPVILITNEHSVSNAEMFSEGFRRLGLGKIVGMPTAGEVIWTTASRLLDGTIFRLPRFKVMTLEGENVECAARPVDVEVDRPLGEALEAKDSQLDVAVRELLIQLDK